MERNKYVDISLISELKKHFGFDSFKGNQEDIIRSVLDGNDTFVLMPTGGGKSLCYQLPALIMDGTCIIVSPLIALMKNQVDSIRGFSIDEGIAHFLNSSLSRPQIAAVRKSVLDGRTKMLYVAPESLTKEENVQFLQQIKISFYAIDEAHCISEWGHDFRPEYRRIRAIVNEIGAAPIITLTATATPKVQNDIQKNLGMMHAKVFKSSFNRPNLYYEIRPKVNVVKEIIKYIKNNEGKSGIIYCLSRKRVEDLAEILRINGIKALAYHAGMDSATRSENQDRFLMEDVDVIVATIAFGMGIDKPDVRFVIHFDIPKSLEGYYQETGRGGRDMGEGQCIAFYSDKDISHLEKFMQGKPIAEQEISKQLLLEVVSYAESSVCRRKTLLNYFGEDYMQDNCGNCDNCLHPKEKFEGKDDMQLVLELILEVKEEFKTEHIVNILCGERNSMTKTYKHEELEAFGAGADQSALYWNAIIRQGLILHFIVKDIENYGLLRVSEKGIDFMKNPYSLMLARDHEYESDDDIDDLFISKSGGGGAADEELFAMLKDLRKSMAKKLKVPPFVLFQDTSLEDMATQYPITIDELKNCQGVGEGKAKKYGQEFIQLIEKYTEEREIERPQDMVIKSMGYKSGAKVFVIQSIDHKLPLEEIARAKNIEMDELLTEIEAIVGSGTKLNIDYYIDYTIDEDKRDDIYDYFHSDAQNESIDDAIRELGSNYTEEEVRLVRIKFLSEFN